MKTSSSKIIRAYKMQLKAVYGLINWCGRNQVVTNAVIAFLYLWLIYIFVCNL